MGVGGGCPSGRGGGGARGWRAFVTLLLFSSLFLSLLEPSSCSPEIRILSAERRIDLTSSIIRAYLTLKVENVGSSSASEVLLAFPPTQAKNIALIQASIPEGKRKKKTYVPLSINPTTLPGTPNDAQLFSILLLHPLKIGETAVLEVLLILTHALEPFPAEIGQSESQLVYYHDSAVMLSPYHIREQITYIKTPNTKLESYSRLEPTNRVGTELRYGRYDDRTPYSFSPILVHFENNNPFSVVEELTRVVEISHWGSLQVTEHYKLFHAGARHKGIFSRLEYQSRAAISGISSLRRLLAILPPRVHSVYYRDEIGNISTSHLRVDSQKSELEIEPRYPLFGGWKSTFVIGYGLPLKDFLFEASDGRRYLNFSFGCPLMETVVDKLVIKVMLPEGSKNPSASVPFPIAQKLEVWSICRVGILLGGVGTALSGDESSREEESSSCRSEQTSFSYLDVVGRPTVVLEKENVVPEHNTFFQVHYSFSPVFMLAEPLMLAVAFFLFFVACIAYLHVDLSIGKS